MVEIYNENRLIARPVHSMINPIMNVVNFSFALFQLYSIYRSCNFDKTLEYDDSISRSDFPTCNDIHFYIYTRAT